jgi:hypothetical protein
MSTDELFCQLKKTLTEIHINLMYLYNGDSKREEYFKKDFTDPIGEPTYGDIGPDLPVYDNPDYVPPMKIWDVIFNDMVMGSFISRIKDLSNNLISEYYIEQKISKYIGISDFTPEEYFTLLGETYKRIVFDPEKKSYQMIGSIYDPLFEEYNFKYRKSTEINEFFRKLKITCHDLLNEGIDKFSLDSSSLNWLKSKTDLSELIAALIAMHAVQTKDFKFDRKPVAKEFEKFFNIDLKNMESLLSHGPGNSTEPGRFLKELTKAYKDHIEKKLE